MLLIRWLTLRSVRTRPMRLLLSTFGIVLGVAGIVAIGATNRSAIDAVTRLFQDTSGKSNLVITSAGSAASGFTEKVLPRLENLAGVAAAVPSLHAQALLTEDVAPAELGLSFFGTDSGGLVLYGIDPRLDRLARTYTLVAGEFLSSDLDAAEIVLVDSFAEEKELRLGGSVEILTGSSIETLRLVGLVAKEGAGQLNNGAFGVISLQTAQRLFYRQGKLDQIDIVAAAPFKEGERLEALKQDLQARLGSAYSVIYPASQGKRMTQMLGNYQIGLNFLSGIALFVGAFLIYNAFSMTVVERTREFGLLRTVGMTRAQVTRQVLSEAVVLGVAGSGLGLGLGLLMARGLARLMEVMLAQDLTNIQVPQQIMITSAMVGLSVTLLAASIPAYGAGRISPLEALRIRSSSGAGWLIRHGWWLGLGLLALSTVILVINPFPYDVQFRMGSAVVFSLFVGGTLMIPISVSAWEFGLRPAVRLFYGSSGHLGSRNIQRARLRTALTVAALMVGVAMIVVVWAMTGSFKADLDEWLDGYIGGDLYVSSSLPMGKDVWRRLEAVEGVGAVAPVRYFEVGWIQPDGSQETVSFMAVDPAAYARVTSFVFSQTEAGPQQALQQLSAGDTVFISSVIAEKYGLQPGDQITLLARTGQRNFRVAAVVVDFYNQGLVIDGSWSDMNRYFRQRDANAFLIKVEAGYALAEVQARIDRLYGKRDRLVIASNQDILRRVSVLTQQAFSMFDVLAIISMLVGFLGITNTMTMNVMERTQEIGMLRSIGMTRGQVLRMIMAEAGLMGLIGGFLGLAFGVILSRIFLLAMTAMSGYRLMYVLPVERLGIALLVAVLIANLAAVLPALRATRVRILEAIHYE